MNRDKLRLTTAFALLSALSALSAPGYAQQVNAIYRPDKGLVVIPRLQVGTSLYYVSMKSTNGSLNFNVRGASVTDLSQPVGFTPASTTDIIGTFSIADGSQVTLNANGTYSMTQAPNVDSNCSAGGIETGTYQYDATTGVLEPVTITSDGNKTCGFSDPNDQDSPTRVRKIGFNLSLYFRESGQWIDVPVTRKP